MNQNPPKDSDQRQYLTTFFAGYVRYLHTISSKSVYNF